MNWNPGQTGPGEATVPAGKCQAEVGRDRLGQTPSSTLKALGLECKHGGGLTWNSLAQPLLSLVSKGTGLWAEQAGHGHSTCCPTSEQG